MILTALFLSVVAAVPPAPSVSDPPVAERPVVATHYFYWYRWPDHHFHQPGAPGHEGHTHHFAEPERVDWRSADWHAEQFRAMAQCGIDVALPVYWGAPGAYDRRGTSFSVEGLAPMVQALDALAAAGEEGVKLGLFYDTSTLLRSVRGLPPGDEAPDRPDLTTAAGKALYCDTIVEYFARIPPRHWARFRGRPLVVTYVSGFAARWDDTLGPALRTAFAARFPGEDPFLVADASWGEIGQDRTTSWGAALHGPRLFPGTAQVGPGYDDSPVPGRRTPLRSREDGNFYAWSWRAAVASDPSLVLVETWNEMHEGTEICATIETGSTYLDLTRAWTRRLHARDPGPPLPAPGPLRLRPDYSFGAEAAGAPEVSIDFTGPDVARCGLREIPWEDGPLRVTDGALRPRRSAAGAVTYLYFQISDHWRFDVDAEFAMTVTTRGSANFALQYDSRDAGATLEGAYTTARSFTTRPAGEATIRLYRLPAARFANRQNGGADFRFAIQGEDVAVLAIRILP